MSRASGAQDSTSAASEGAAVPSDGEARWGAVIAAYRSHSESRRDADRMRKLEQARAQTGFDAAVAEAFRQVCRGHKPGLAITQALDALEPAEQLDLLQICFEQGLPIRTLTYPARGPLEPDSELAQLGISVEALQRTADNYPSTNRFFPYYERVLQDRRVELESPLSGRPLVSTGSLLLVTGSGRPIIAYHFVDGEPFFLITNPHSGGRTAFYFPERELMLSLPAESPRVMATFRALVVEFASETVEYLTHAGERPLALLTGTMNHLGHSILNEYEAYHQCVEGGLFDGVDVVLRGWANFVPHAEVFPALGDLPVVQLADAVDAYRTVVAGGYLVVRPTCNYWFSVGLGDRLRTAARRHREANPPARLAAAERRWPLLWIEIRSNDRCWVDQDEQVPQLIDSLAAHFPELGVVAGGWSRMLEPHPQDEKMVQSDCAIVNRIKEKLSCDVPIFDISGVGTVEKMCWALAADAFISTNGTGPIFPCLIGESPGVMHTNEFYTELFEKYPARPLVSYSEAPTDIRFIGSEHITDENPDASYGVRNHYLGWRPVFDELMVILSCLTPRVVEA